MSKEFLKKLYDMAAEFDEEEGIDKFNEAKFRKEMALIEESNKKNNKSNKEIFAEGEPRFHNCQWYEPCPICDKCKNKASHLYVRCQNCQIPICSHTHKNKSTMIRRANFELVVKDKEIRESILELKKNIEK